MSWFKKSNTKEAPTPIIIFNLGGTSVSGLVLDGTNFDFKQEIKHELPFASYQNFATLSAQTVEILGKVAEQIRLTVGPNQKKIHCLVSSPWHMADISRYKIPENKIKQKATIDNISAKALAKHLEKNTSPAYDLKPIDSVVMAIRELVQDRDATAPTDNILHHFASSSDKKLLETISQPIANSFGQTQPSFHSGLLATFSAINDALTKYSDFVILDISGEITDIIIVRHHTIATIASIPIGTYTVARRLAKKTGQNVVSAYSSLKLLGENILQNHSHHDFDTLVADVKQEWLYDLMTVLNSYETKDENLPLVVVGDDKSATVLGDWAKFAGSRESMIADEELLADLYPSRRSPSRVTGHLVGQLFAQKYLWYTRLSIIGG